MFVKENPDRKKKHIVNCSPENVLLSVGCKEVQRGGGLTVPSIDFANYVSMRLQF